jgi:protein-disulfide isomerase
MASALCAALTLMPSASVRGWLDTLSILGVLTLVGLLARRELRVPEVSSDRLSAVVREQRVVDDDATLRVWGSTSADIRVIVFEDLECPFCARFHETISSFAAKNPDRVSLDLVHFPIPSHRFARLAALAVECAADVGRVAPMVGALFRYQDSLGLKPIGEIAANAGVDSVRLGMCIRSPSLHHRRRIERGIEEGKRFGVRGTPTVIVNGLRFTAAPDANTLDSLLAGVLSVNEKKR